MKAHDVLLAVMKVTLLQLN